MQSTPREVFALGFTREIHVLYITPVTCTYFKSLLHLECGPKGLECLMTLVWHCYELEIVLD